MHFLIFFGFFFLAVIIFLLKKEAGIFHSISLYIYFFFPNLLALSFLANSNLDQASDRKELIQKPESYGWELQIMQVSEGLAAILEYRGRETRRDKIYAKQEEKLQQLHLILGTPDSKRSVIGSPPVIWCLLALN